MAIAITLSNGRTWKTKAAAPNHFKAILARYPDGAVVDERSDHDDLGAVRYPLALIPKTSLPMSEQRALDILTLLALTHRKLDHTRKTTGTVT